MLSFLIYCYSYLLPFSFLQDRARDLAELVGGQALSLAELNSFHPETGMILANTTSIGMQPKVEETPISKVGYVLPIKPSVPSMFLLHPNSFSHIP